MIRHTIKLEGEAAKGARISARVLNMLLEMLLDASQRSLRLRVEGRSHMRGETDWLNAAADFELVGLNKGSTLLELETRSLGECAPELFQQLPLWDNSPRPEQSALGLFESTLRDALTGNEESDLLDRNVLESIARFNVVLGFGYSSCIFDGNAVEGVTITSDGLYTAQRLRDEAPAPQRIIVSGVLDQMTHSRRTFVLRLEAGVLRGVLPSDHISAYRDLLGEKVVIEGEATFRPSGTVSVIAAHTIRLATKQDVIWEQAPRPGPRVLGDLRPRSSLPPGESGFSRIFGKWPGDETDEEVAIALEEIS